MCHTFRVFGQKVFINPLKGHNLSGLLTKKFINLLKQGKDDILDLNEAAETLKVIWLHWMVHFGFLNLFALDGVFWYSYNIMLNEDFY